MPVLVSRCAAVVGQRCPSRATLGIVAAGLGLLNREVRVLAESYGSGFRFDFLGPGDALAVVVFAGLLGSVGAQLAVARQLREIEPA